MAATAMRTLALLLLCAARAAADETAKAYIRAHWEANFATGDRALLTTREVGGDDGADKIRVMCVARGSGSRIQEPLTLGDIHSSLIRFQKLVDLSNLLQTETIR